MLVKFDSHNDNVVYDLIQGKFVEPKDTRGRKSTIPFSAPTFMKKLKPNTKVRKKVGTVWLSSQKLSMTYILANHLLKSEKTRLAAFIKKSDKNYIFIEVSVSANNVNTSYKWITDDPRDFLVIEGKNYDTIIGDPMVATEIIDWAKLWKEYSTDAKPLQVAAVVFMGLVIVMASLYMFGVIGKKKVNVRTAAQAKQQQQIPPLSSGEVKVLSLLVTQEMLQEYKNFTEALEQTPDIAIKTATIKVGPAGPNEVKGSVAVVYESIYPYPGSSKSGDFYTMNTEAGSTKKREDIRTASPVVAAAKDGRLTALGALIDSGDVASRDKDAWKFSITIKEDYKAVVKMLNAVYLTPVVINSLTIEQSSTRGELVLHNL